MEGVKETVEVRKDQKVGLIDFDNMTSLSGVRRSPAVGQTLILGIGGRIREQALDSAT